jgi:hypothetical protein
VISAVSNCVMKMGFDAFLCTLLEQYSTHTPRAVDVWYGPWMNILATLFPPSQNYVVTPRRRVKEVSSGRISDLIIEVAKVSLPPIVIRTVLIVQIKNWDQKQEDLIQQIGRWTDFEFLCTAAHRLYWIGVVGPHWVYGEKEDNGQDPKPLIGWHDVTHDDASYRDLLQLAELVASL